MQIQIPVQVIDCAVNNLVDDNVIHITPGRVRIRIPRLLNDDGYADRLYILVTALSGIITVRINLHARSLTVHYDSAFLDQETLLGKLSYAIHAAKDPLTAGIKVVAEPDAGAEATLIDPMQRLVLPSLGLALALVVAPLELPILPVLIGGITLYAALPVFINAAHSAFRGEVNADTLESVWTMLHTWEGHFVAPNLDMTIAGTAETLRDATGQNIHHGWQHLLPVDSVHVVRDGQERRIPLQEVQRLETIVLYPGEMVPIDGTVLDGEGLLDVSTLNGEAVPIPCCSDDRILAGSLVIEGKLWVRVDYLEADTEYMQEVQLAETLLLHHTEIAAYAEEVGKSLMLPSLTLSGMLLLFTGDIARSLAPLQLDLATGISISAPTAVLSTIEQAKQASIYVRAGHALETLAKADLVVFSKTGTLTEGKLAVLRVEPIQQYVQADQPIAITEETEETTELISLAASELLMLAASVKRGLRHPVAEAIVEYAVASGVEILPCEDWTHHRNYGLGVSALINGSQVLVGQRHYLASEGIDMSAFPPPVAAVEDAEVQGMWYVYVAKDEQLLGRIDCYDRVRPESQAVITALRDRGLEVHMVTSNSQEVAKIVATALELPMSFIHADLHPEQKLRLVQEWQAAGKTVVYIGEGIDDYVALRAADVAVGSHRSCPLNRETADLLLPNDNLHSLLAIMDMAQTAIEIIHQNIALIAIPNISVVALGMIFALNPIIAVIVSQSVNLLAEINGLRPLWAGGKRKKASGTAPTKVYSATHFG
jgi:Cu2+-exporting ATPase